VSVRSLALSALVCAVLVVAGRYLFDISWQSALVLAPVFVLIVGGIAFLVLLWAKVIRDSLRGRRARA
jgi:ATP/ADP translocase